MRHFQFKRGLRRLRRKHPDKAAIIDQALANEEILAEACAWSEEGYEGYSANASGPFMDFLDWLIANGPALFEFITKLIDLFSATP